MRVSGYRYACASERGKYRIYYAMAYSEHESYYMWLFPAASPTEPHFPDGLPGKKFLK